MLNSVHMIAAASLLGVVGSCAFGEIQRYELDMSMLPSAQGWTYDAFASSGMPAAENDVFSVSNGVLTVNSIGQGNQSRAGYELWITDETFTGVTEIRIQTRVRVLELERLSGLFPPAGVAFVGVSQVAVAPIYLSDEYVFTQQPNSEQFRYALDTSVFHDYEIRVDTATRIFRLFVDGELVLMNLAPKDSNTYLQLFEGGGANVHAEIASARWILIPSAPTAGVLGIAGLLAVRRRR
jgi:hypothetical protein